MIADRDVEPVGQQCVIGVAEHAPNVRGVLPGGVEIRVVAWMDANLLLSTTTRCSSVLFKFRSVVCKRDTENVR